MCRRDAGPRNRLRLTEIEFVKAVRSVRDGVTVAGSRGSPLEILREIFPTEETVEIPRVAGCPIRSPSVSLPQIFQ